MQKSLMRVLIVGALFGASVHGEDISLPLDDGNISIIQAQFLRVSQYGTSPELNFKLKNQTSSSWRTLKLQFDIGGLCNGEPSQWMIPITTSLGWAEDHQVVKEIKDISIPLVGKMNGCTTEIIKASMVFAENIKTRIDGVTGERIDFERQLRDLKAKREAEAAVQAEQERAAAEAAAETQAKAAEAQAKKDAVDAVRRKQQADEQKKKQVEAEAKYAKVKAEEEAKDAERRRILRANCTVIYQNTIDKKLKDLTVREDQQVGACRALSLYPPS